MNGVILKTYSPPTVNFNEIKRYAGYGNEKGLTDIINECLTEVSPLLTYKLCYTEVSVDIVENEVSLGDIKINSSSLAKALNGCKTAIIFGATIGFAIDRLILKYGKISQLKSLIFQAVGAERVESLINTFVSEIEKEYLSKSKKLTRRFSAGYGDFPLTFQTHAFQLLNLNRLIGVTLNESLVMSPSKSVTAVIGVKDL